MVAVTVSREHGAGGTDIGHKVAEGLGGRYLDRDLIEMAFQFAGLPVPQSASAESPIVEEEEMPGLAHRIVDAFTSQISAGLRPWPRYTPPKPERVGEEDSLLREVVDSDEAYVAMMKNVIERIVQEYPNVVIVGRGGQCVLSGRPGVLHVHICANLADRVRHVMEEENLSEGEASALVRSLDDERARYIRRYYGEDWLRPCLYHLTLNTSWLTHDEAADLVLQAARVVEKRG